MFRYGLDARKFLQRYCVCGCVCICVCIYIDLVLACESGCCLFDSPIKQITALLWHPWMSLCFRLCKTFSITNYCHKLNCCQSSLNSKHSKASRLYDWLTLDPCDFVMCPQKRLKKREEKLRPFPFPTIYLWTDRFLSQECSLSLFPDGIQCDQWECVFVKLPTLRPTALLSPIRPVKSRVWQRRRGPICSPC